MKNNIIYKRNIGADFVKFLCSFMIVCIHTPYYGKEFIEPLTRCAVPIFFISTGYFYSFIKQNKKDKIQLKKTAKLFLYSNLLYLIWGLLNYYFYDSKAFEALNNVFKIRAWIGFILFNESFFSSHLWYIQALLYVLIIINLVDKYSNREKLYRLIPVLLLLNIVLGSYSIVVFGVGISLLLSRNFLLCGLPFFLIGDLIYNKKNKIKITHGELVIITIFSVLISLAENWMLINSGRLLNKDLFIATPFLACSLFIIFLHNKPIYNSKLFNKITQINRDTSAAVYIIHPIIIVILFRIVNNINMYIPAISIVWNCIAPIITFIITTLIVYGFKNIKRRFKLLNT